MKKIYIIYKQKDKIKKAVLDENMYRNYKQNTDIEFIQEFETETLMEKAYADKVGTTTGRRTLLD